MKLIDEKRWDTGRGFVRHIIESAASTVELIGLTSSVVAAFFMPTWSDLLAAWSEGKRRTLDDDQVH